MGCAEIEIRPAESSESEAVGVLLLKSGLPIDGLREHFSHALVATRADEIVGCVALELYGRYALLRSLAVAKELRGLRLGERLVEAALRLSSDAGAGDVYLLTETAERFFPRFGFVTEDRSLAPALLQESAEFRTACPASAVLMHARITR